ncbi:MAG TPA: diacylglycerol kinase family protein [Anaerolineae bacterium]|nr:diacylglycerol kinase family protein [Anaerolineae bacterium]
MTDRRRAHSRIAAFRYAFAGWLYVLRTQRNAWLHAIATIASVAVGIWLKLDRLDWALLVLAIGIVWLSEFINSALEAIVDLASPEIHPLARVGKDVGAAAVLIAAATAATIGLLVLGPPLWSKITTIW